MTVASKSLTPDVSVNGQVISASDIAAEAQNHSAPKGKPGIAWRKAAQALVIRELMLQEAKRLGLKTDPQAISDGKVETEDEALIRAVMEVGVTPDPISEDRARARYDANPDGYRAPTLFEAAHILFMTPPGDTEARDKSRLRAKAALQILHKRPDDFGDLAKSQSDCPSRDAGGRLGQIGHGDTVPEFESVLNKLNEGEITDEAVETRYGFHIIRLDARAVGEVLPFTAVRQTLMDALEKEAWTAAARDFTMSLVDGADITGIKLSQELAAA